MLTILSSCFRASKGERECVAVVGCLERELDELKTVRLVEDAPAPRSRAEGAGFLDLLNRAVFDERTGAVAISHGVSSFLSMAAGDGGC
jgi:hypothetical protein